MWNTIIAWNYPECRYFLSFSFQNWKTLSHMHTCYQQHRLFQFYQQMQTIVYFSKPNMGEFPCLSTNLAQCCWPHAHEQTIPREIKPFCSYTTILPQTCIRMKLNFIVIRTNSTVSCKSIYILCMYILIFTYISVVFL